MIDSPPAHPDTALTTLKDLKKCLTAFEMDYIHLTVYMQLYQLMCKIKWSDPKTWTHLVLHPGMMHNLMSFIGAIGTLMKSSGLEQIINAALLGYVKSISNGKA